MKQVKEMLVASSDEKQFFTICQETKDKRKETPYVRENFTHQWLDFVRALIFSRNNNNNSEETKNLHHY